VKLREEATRVMDELLDLRRVFDGRIPYSFLHFESR
jgi:hypothetical protein